MVSHVYGGPKLVHLDDVPAEEMVRYRYGDGRTASIWEKWIEMSPNYIAFWNKWDPGAMSPHHSHTGDHVNFILAGEITDVHILGSSGVQYLDTVAVESFRIVQRFPNPPPGLIGDAGSIKLPFAFTLLAAANGLRLQVGPGYLPGSPAARGC